MALYTYGGTPADVLTTVTGDVVPDYPLRVRVAGTGQLVTALYELDGVTPIGELRTNAANSPQPGAVRPFKTDVPAIDFEYLAGDGSPLRWYQSGREVAQLALAAAQDSLSKADGGTVEGPLTAAAGLDVQGPATFEDVLVSGGLSVEGTFSAGGGISLAGMRIFNPKLFGTNTPGLQAALNAARDAGGGWVIVPSDVYLITSTLRIYRNTRLTLLPGGEFRQAFAGTMLLNGDADQPYGGYTGHGNITLEGGVWNMRGTTPGMTGNAMCISIGHARGVTIRDIEIRDVSGFHGIELNSTKNALIDNCKFLGYVDNTGDASRGFSEAVQFDLAKSSGVFGGFGPYDNTVCEDITMRDCYVGASGTAGTVAWPRGVGSHSATVGTTHRRIKIERNSFEGCAQYGVVAYAYDDSEIAGNTMRNCGSGIRCRTIISADAADSTNLAGVVTNASQIMRNLTIDRNIIIGSTGYDDAILLYGETTGRLAGITITGNVIETTAGGESGIRIFYTSEYTVTGNVVRNASGTGISQEQVIGGVIGVNRVVAPGGSGISCDTGTGITIVANQVRDAGSNGVHVLSGSDVQVLNNYIKGASRSASGSWGIRCSTSVDALFLTGNKIRKFGSGNEVAAGIGITSTCTNVRRYGNDLGDTGLDDQSPNPITGASDTGAGAITSIVKAAQTDRASTVAPASDPHLTLPVAPNSTYDLECVGVWSGAGGLRATWSVPAGASMVWTDNDGVGVSSATGVVTFTGTTGTTLKGTLVTGATSGSVTLQWAQATSNAAVTSLRAGSSLKLTRLT